MNPSRTSFITDRPVAVLMVFTAAVVFGFFSFKRLPVTLMPELNYPTLTVRTEYPGAAPEEVENEISRPIEEALGVVSGLNRISSVSRAGISDVVLEFIWGTDMGEATQNTLEKLDLVFLPREAERPLILHFDPALDPIMELSFSGSGDKYEGEEGLRRLRRLAELQIKRALEPVEDVAAVRVRGGLEEEIHVLLSKTELQRTGLSIQEVIDRIRQENINVAGGTILEGKAEFMVRTLNEFESLEQIADTVVLRSGNRNVRVRDLGTVLRSHKEREILTRTDGLESVQIDIFKEADANIVAVAEKIRNRIGAIQPSPSQAGPAGTRPGSAQRGQSGLADRLWKEEGARLQVVADRSLFIKSSIDEVRKTAVLGGLLAIAVLFLFLRDLKTTLIIGLSIPMSLLMTFAPMNLAGVTLNIMSLGGLALGIGMLVDSSIVVLESIFRCRQEGDPVREAAIRGTREVRAAVIASTLTTIAVFFPMVFVEGLAGQVFGDLGLAVVISLSASLLVAIFFIPMLASRQAASLNANPIHLRHPWKQWVTFQEVRRTWNSAAPRWKPIFALYLVPRLLLGCLLELIGKVLLTLIAALSLAIRKGIRPLLQKSGAAFTRGPLRLTDRFYQSLHKAYPPCLSAILHRPGTVFGILLAAFATIYFLGRSLETELLPEVHQGEFTLEVDLPVGTPLEQTEQILSQVEQRILEDKTHIHALLVTYGFDLGNMQRSDEGEHSARFKVITTRDGNTAEIEQLVLARLRTLLDTVPEVDIRVSRPVLFSSKRPVVVEIQGDDLVVLKETSQRARLQLADLPELTDVESTLQSGAPEVQISYHRDLLSKYHLNIQDVAQHVRNMVKGFEATRFNLKDRRIPVVVRLHEKDRQQVADVAGLRINPGTNKPITLSAVADIQIGEGPNEIRRIDGERVALIEANMSGVSLGAAVDQVGQTLRSGMAWPDGMTFAITGQNEEWERSEGSLYLALALSLFLVYVIMAAQFESLIQPFIILFTVPLAFFGTVLGLAWLGISLSVVVFLGMIMLVGIVVNNAIVLIDYINTLRSRQMTLENAIITAGQIRLRPILMTTATTVLGLLPMALGFGDGAEVRTPMAVAVIFGLVSSTALTLLIVPAIYYLVERLRNRWTTPPPVSSPAHHSRETASTI